MVVLAAAEYKVFKHVCGSHSEFVLNEESDGVGLVTVLYAINTSVSRDGAGRGDTSGGLEIVTGGGVAGNVSVRRRHGGIEDGFYLLVAIFQARLALSPSDVAPGVEY